MNNKNRTTLKSKATDTKSTPHLEEDEEKVEEEEEEKEETLYLQYTILVALV